MSFLFKSEQRMVGDWFQTDPLPDPRRRPSQESSLRLTSMFAAYRFLVDYISTLPIDAYREDGDTRTELASLPPLLSRQNDPGGPGLVTWIGQAVFGLATGNAVGWINGTDGYGFPADVTWLHWTDWTYNELTKEWYVFGQKVPGSQLVHIPWIVPGGRRLGLSPIEAQAAVIIAGLSAQEYADVKRGGGLPPSVLKNTMKTISPEVGAAAQRRAAIAFARGEVFVTGADWDLTATAIPPNQAHFVETLKMSANQIAAAFGIDPTEVGGTPAGTLTYNTEELRELRRAADCNPYMIRIEEGLSRYLPSKQKIKFNADAKIRADIKTRTEVDGLKIADGRLNVDEAREHDNLGPVPGGSFHNIPHPMTPQSPTKPFAPAGSNGTPMKETPL